MIFRHIFVFVCLLPALAVASDPLAESCKNALIYLTDHPAQLQKTIDNRSPLFSAQTWKEWKDAKVEFNRTEFGELIMIINGLEIMRSFEKPYMASIARAAASAGGRVLNVGYGFGYIDGEIERLRAEFPITEHHIIELNDMVAAQATLWRESQRNRNDIFIHWGDWEAILMELKESGVVFDAIAYDGFPRSEEELHRDFIPFFEKVMELRLIREHTGVITFYMDSPDGFGSRFTEFARSLGVSALSTERVEVELPPNQYWQYPFFLTPKLTRIEFRQSER